MPLYDTGWRTRTQRPRPRCGGEEAGEDERGAGVERLRRVYSPECAEGKFCEVRLAHIERTSKAPRWPNLVTSSTIQRRPQEK
jgi:hypothetical protein